MNLKERHDYGDATHCECYGVEWCYYGSGYDAYVKFSDLGKMTDETWAIIETYADPAPAPEDRLLERGQAGWIYVLEGGGYHKIGRTTNLDGRMKQIVSKLPFEVTLLYKIFYPEQLPGVERGLHEKFADKRVNGEWFKLDEEDLEWFKWHT